MHVLSEYPIKDTLVSRLDVRLKLIVAAALLVMLLSAKGVAFPLLMLLFSLYLCLRLGIPLRGFLLRFSEPLFIASVVLVVKIVSSGHDILFSIQVVGITVTGYRDGLMEGLAIWSRIAGAVSIIITLGFSTPFAELMAGFSWFKAPKDFIEISLFAHRYIFVLIEDAVVIYNAQKNRLGYSTARLSLRSFGTLAASLILKAFENSQNITTAMVQRGYDGNIPKLIHRSFKRSDVVVSLIFLTAAGVMAWRV
ncbi:MAG: cobalt ECF transporter T component CbiQ [Nitrospirae bacterium]|nr:cobalt ECF transporter T component CbiQ [Nitrospirota bacterium]MBF0592592.1 cobalt ECF transporter T component CbiQ [Nitrospirota bacterium]